MDLHPIGAGRVVIIHSGPILFSENIDSIPQPVLLLHGLTLHGFACMASPASPFTISFIYLVALCVQFATAHRSGQYCSHQATKQPMPC
jgi:hypothetical protein